MATLPRVPSDTTIITADQALEVLVNNFDTFIDIVDHTMPRREFLSLPGKDDAYMKALAKVYAQTQGIKSITFVGPEIRNVMDYMDILYIAHGLNKRKALGKLEISKPEDGVLRLELEK